MDRQKLLAKRDKLRSQYNKQWQYILNRLSSRQMSKFKLYGVEPHELRGAELIQITRNKNNIIAFGKLKELYIRQEAIFLTLKEKA